MGLVQPAPPGLAWPAFPCPLPASLHRPPGTRLVQSASAPEATAALKLKQALPNHRKHSSTRARKNLPQEARLRILGEAAATHLGAIHPPVHYRNRRHCHKATSLVVRTRKFADCHELLARRGLKRRFGNFPVTKTTAAQTWVNLAYLDKFA